MSAAEPESVIEAARSPRTEALLLCDFFLPGYRSGGVMRSVASLAESLGADLRLRILTRDRDDGSSVPYPDLPARSWRKLGPAQVMYLSRSDLGPRALARRLLATSHGVLYLNSVFSRPFGILPLLLRWLRLAPRRRLVVAPNGELSEGALAIKPLRKAAYLVVARALGLHADCVWRANSDAEAADVRRRFGPGARVVVIPNLFVTDATAPLPRAAKRPGRLRIVFLSRISRIKNLSGALEMLAGVDGEVQLDVYGPRDADARHWAACQRARRALPANVEVRFRGSVRPERVHETLARYDLFLLPSRGESFGYAILEALAAGCPVLISDRTPWRNLEERGVGWDLPLEDPERFVRVIRRCIELGDAEHRDMSRRAIRYAREVSRSPELEKSHRALIEGGGA